MSRGKQKKAPERKEKEEQLYKMFGNRFRELLEIEYPGTNDSYKAFEVLKKINPDTASICITTIDKSTYTRSIKSWMNGDSMPDSKVDLLNICNLLNCEPGFLLGTQDKPNRGTTDAASETGLNEKSIKRLKKYPPEIKELLNKIILRSNGDDLLKLLQAIYTYALESQHSVIKLEIPEADLFETQNIEKKLIGATSEIGNTLPDISKRMLRYTATTAFDEILINTRNNYVEEGNALLKERINRNADMEKKEWLSLNEKRKLGWRLSPNELRILCCGTIGDNIPTKEQAFEKIDIKAAKKYRLYKKDSPAE